MDTTIDESSLQDRDWYWGFNAIWDKNSTDRCRVKIPDTVFLSGGEPTKWAFTSKEGIIQYKKKANVKWSMIKERFLGLHLVHNQRYNVMTSGNRPLDHGYVAVARSGGGGNFTTQRLTRQDFLDLFNSEGAELRSKCVILQAYVPVKSENGTVYRNEFEQPRRNAFRLQTYKMVYMTGIDGTVVNEKGNEVSAELCQQALKCTAIQLKDHLNAMTMEVIRYIESHKSCHVNAVALEYMVDEVDRQPFLTHLTGLQTGALPKKQGKTAAPADGASGNMSKLLETSVAGTTMGEKKPDGEIYDLLNKKKKMHRRRKEGEEEEEEEEQMYQLPFKSVLLARLDEALAKENESPRYKAVRQMAVAQELSKLNPSHFYRHVRVPEKHYRMYNLLDKQRTQNIEDAKQLVQASKVKKGRKSSEWWQTMNTSEGENGVGTFDNSKQKQFAKLCRNLCQNHTLCEQLCLGSNGIKKDGPLPRILKQMVDSIVGESNIYAEDDAEGDQASWDVEPTPPWILTSDKSRWRRELTPTFSPSGYGSKSEHEVIAEAEAKLERARLKIEDEQRRRSRSNTSMGMDGNSRSRRDYSRSESAPPTLPDISNDASTSSRHRVGVGAPQLHTGQRPILPIVAASPAVTASRADSHNFPKKLPTSGELRTRHELDTSTIEYQEMYEDGTAAEGRSFVEEEPPLAGADASVTEAEPAAEAVEPGPELYTSTTPVPGKYCRFDETTTVKYEVLESTSTAAGAPHYLVVFNDFFESYEKYEMFLQPLLGNLAKGSQLLLVNFPGQAYTEFPAGGTLNNEFLADVVSGLLSELKSRGQFCVDPASKCTPIAVGNGANVAAYWISKMQRDGATHVPVESAVLINPFLVTDAHLSLVLQNWLNTYAPSCPPRPALAEGVHMPHAFVLARLSPASRPTDALPVDRCDISQLFQFDLQLYFFSHLLFSEKYLQEKTPTTAFERYTEIAGPNHITLCVHIALPLLLSAAASADTRGAGTAGRRSVAARRDTRR
jgi:hypothetical protein